MLAVGLFLYQLMKIFYSGKRNNIDFFQESLSELLNWEHLSFFSFFGRGIEANFGIRMDTGRSRKIY